MSRNVLGWARRAGDDGSNLMGILMDHSYEVHLLGSGLAGLFEEFVFGVSRDCSKCVVMCQCPVFLVCVLSWSSFW